MTTRPRKSGKPGTTVDAFRRLALALPETEELPHFDATSFRVRGKIFATIPPENEIANLMVADDEALAAIARLPIAYQELWWGNKLWGLRVTLAAVPTDDVSDLIEEAWRRKAPKRVVAAYDAR